MTPADALVDVTTRLLRLRVPNALVGGLAAIARLRSPFGVDRTDARRLLATGVVDLDEARRLLSLIEARGFARDQDLGAKLASVLAGASLGSPRRCAESRRVSLHGVCPCLSCLVAARWVRRHQGFRGVVWTVA